MTITKRPLLLVAALMLLLASCKLDKPDFATFRDSTTTGGGTTTGQTGTYQPVSKGSYWKYANTINSVTDTTITTITGATAMIDGRNYYEGASSYLSGTEPADTGYLSRDNHVYIDLSLSDGVDVELYYLNDTTAVGHGWTSPINSTGQIMGVSGQFVGKIMERNITRTVNGKVFNNVIHSQVELQYDYGSGFTTTIVYDNYVAQNIGIIEIDSNGLGITGVETLLAYSIK